MLNENFFYDSMTKPITEQILSLMKSGVKHYETHTPWLYSDIPILEDSKYVVWSFNLVRHPLDFRPDIWASAGVSESFEPSLDISVVITKGRHQKKAHIDYAELYGVIAHELHHIAQNTEETGQYFPVWETGSEQLDYLVDPIEVEAFNLGFRAQAHISDKPVEDIMEHYLKMKKLSSKEIEFVMSLWLNTDYPVLKKNLEKV